MQEYLCISYVSSYQVVNIMKSELLIQQQDLDVLRLANARTKLRQI